MIDLKTLEAQVSPELLEAARNAMDLNSISVMKFDSRGRLEAGVKPAPPSIEPASYVRITSRGKAFLVDCRAHGRAGWCLHAAILALHHLGQKPNYVIRKPTIEVRPQVGYRLIAAISAEGADFRILSLSTGRYLRLPLSYLKENHQNFALNQRARELMEDLGEECDLVFTVGRLDLALLLNELDDVQLYHPAGELWVRVRAKNPPPDLRVRLEGATFSWSTDRYEPQTVFVPGWPGYLIVDNQIRRFPGYVPDFQHLQGAQQGTFQADGPSLLPFCREKHRVIWETPRPVLIDQPEQVGLSLEVQRGELLGRLGFWDGDQFLPLNDINPGPRLFPGKMPRLLTPHPMLMNQIYQTSRKLKAPWEDASFRIREGQAIRFLEEASYPDHWRVQTLEAEKWFGLTPLDVHCEWREDGPRYRIDHEWFSHQSLLGGLAEGNRVKLADGRVLNIDTREIKVNNRILAGAGALHEDASARHNLVRRILGEELAEDVVPEIAASWRKLLRSYQLEGVQWLTANFQRQEPSLLADDMGLGKTIQTLAFLDTVRQDLPQLVVAPKSLLQNWQAEANRFCKHRQVTIHHGASRIKDPQLLQNRDLVITTYGTILRDLEMLYDVEFQVVVLDEAQAIKNSRSQTAQAVSELWSQNRLALTGTPVENRLTELWSIFQFLAPGYLGDEDELKHIHLPGSAAFMAVRAKVGPFVKRRLKTEVEKDLPEKQEITVTLPMADGQAALYQQYLRRSGGQGKDQSTMSILTRLLRLRQICCHPGLVDPLNNTMESNKVSFLLEQLEEIVAGGNAALVFSQFTSLLKLVKFQLEEMEMPCLYLDGRSANRHELVERFQKGEAPVFLISLKAGGTGLNLTRAGYVYHLDPWWNPAVEAQATDRAHRIGQTQKVFSYKLISEGTVEEKILKLQLGKRMLADGLWDEDGSGGLNRETMLELLS